MIADLKPYGEYKDSGLPWLGQVPAHWGTRRMKFLFHDRSEKGHPNEPLLAATQTKGVVRKEDYGLRTVTAVNGLENLKLVEVGDFVISLRSFQGGIEVSHARGIISPAYTVLCPRSGFDPNYFRVYFKCADFISSLTLFVTGIREGQNIDYERLSRAFIPLPPPSEQAAIVRFLDWASGRLERAIRAKRKIVALLNEQKQAIIHRAVTRGLDPNVRLKDSGVPWLGEIPAHWEVTSLRRYWTVTDCKHLTVPFVEDGMPIASVVDVQKFSLDLSRSKRTKPDWYNLLIEGDRKPKRGDLIYCRNASVGACALVDTDSDFAMGQDVCLIRSFSQNQKFLNYLLHSSFMRNQLNQLLVGSTFKRINISEIKTLAVIVPPRLEQDSICEYLDTRIKLYDTAISRLEREIDLLREYRTRLVTDVVTGKLDVREAAARLPDEEAVSDPVVDEETCDIPDDEDFQV
jgi:type I restriction enzyme S subunit